MAQVIGNIVQSNGTPISEAVITVIATEHSSIIEGDILKDTSFDVVCGTDGGYSFPLAVGSYTIQVMTGRTTVTLEDILIDNNTPDGIDILELVSYQGVSVGLAQQILNEATALSIAQSTAVMSAVLSNDGVGSGLDADLFQGQTLSQVLTTFLASGGIGSGLDADLFQGQTLDEVLATPTTPLAETSNPGNSNNGNWTKLLTVSGLGSYNGGTLLFSLTSAKNYGGSIEFTVNYRTGGSANIESVQSDITVTEHRYDHPMNNFKMVSNGTGSFEVWVQVNGFHHQSILSSVHSTLEQQGNIQFFSNQPWVSEPIGTLFNKHSVNEINLNEGMDTGWLPITLQNSWVAHSSTTWAGVNGVPSYRKMPDGTVEVRGQIASGTYTHGVVIANLPIGFRPASNVKSFCVTGGEVSCGLNIYTNGNIHLIFLANGGAGDNSRLGFNLNFSTE